MIEKYLLRSHLLSLLCFALYWQGIREFIYTVDSSQMPSLTYTAGIVLIAGLFVLPGVVVGMLLISKLFIEKDLSGRWALCAFAQSAISVALAVFYFEEIEWFLS